MALAAKFQGSRPLPHHGRRRSPSGAGAVVVRGSATATCCRWGGVSATADVGAGPVAPPCSRRPSSCSPARCCCWTPAAPWCSPTPPPARSRPTPRSAAASPACGLPAAVAAGGHPPRRAAVVGPARRPAAARLDRPPALPDGPLLVTALDHTRAARDLGGPARRRHHLCPRGCRTGPRLARRPARPRSPGPTPGLRCCSPTSTASRPSTTSTGTPSATPAAARPSRAACSAGCARGDLVAGSAATSSSSVSPGLAPAAASRLVRRLVQDVAQPLVLPQGLFTVGVSIGLAVSGTGTTAKGLLARQADGEMYREKSCRPGRGVPAPRTSGSPAPPGPHPPDPHRPDPHGRARTDHYPARTGPRERVAGPSRAG